MTSEKKLMTGVISAEFHGKRVGREAIFFQYGVLIFLGDS